MLPLSLKQTAEQTQNKFCDMQNMLRNKQVIIVASSPFNLEWAAF